MSDFTITVKTHSFPVSRHILSLVNKQKSKSEIAAKAVREMNPAMNITAHQNRLDVDSEKVYDYNFYMGLDGVAAALDNVEASKHICIFGSNFFVFTAFSSVFLPKFY